MKGKVCLLSGLLFAQLSIGLFTAYSVNASSVYDNAVNITDTLTINGSDVGASYLTMVEELCNSTHHLAYVSAFDDGSWAIINDATANNIYIYWDNDTVNNLNWNNSGGTSWVSVGHDNKHILLQGYGTDVTCTSYEGTTSSTLSTSANTNKKIWISTFAPNYPVGYEGATIPNTQDTTTYLQPHVEYFVDGTKVTARYQNNLENDIGESDLHFNWNMAKQNDEETAYDIIDGSVRGAGPPPMQQSITAEYIFDVGEYGSYSLNLYDAEIVPTIENLDVYNAFILLEIDGSTYSGNTKDMDCTEGICVPAPIYEECDVADMWCHFRNFGVMLKSMLVGLFVPNGVTIREKFNAMMSSLMTTLGFLGYPLDFIIGVFGAISNNTTALGGKLNFGNFFGGNVQIDLAALQTANSSLFDLVMNIVRGSTVLSLIFILRRKYLEVVTA